KGPAPPPNVLFRRADLLRARAFRQINRLHTAGGFALGPLVKESANWATTDFRNCSLCPDGGRRRVGRDLVGKISSGHPHACLIGAAGAKSYRESLRFVFPEQNIFALEPLFYLSAVAR